MCGVVGISGDPDAVRLAVLGLHALQHRGQEGAGIAASAHGFLQSVTGLGLVSEVLTDATVGRLSSDLAIGHVRYGTSGGATLQNVQPYVVNTLGGQIALCHNGTLTNARALQAQLVQSGAIFSRTSDTEVILHLYARSTGSTFVARLVDALKQVEGAWSIVAMSPDRLVAARDPRGFRPLVLGRMGNAFVVASETCALTQMGAEVVREILPGEVVERRGDSVYSTYPFPTVEFRPCMFEHVYVARPDSVLFGKGVYDTRVALGRALARLHPKGVDVVVPVPDSGVPAALGYAAALGVPYGLGLLRSHYVGRTFIQPTQTGRDVGVALKLHVIESVIKGKRLVVIDDSIVRGTTARRLVQRLRSAGAVEVHLLSTSPPMVGPCHYGMDTPSKTELLACTHTHEQMVTELGVDSLGFLPLGSIREIIGTGHCDACFSGHYPVRPT